MIRRSEPEDFEAIYEVINDAAAAYKGVIPADRWHDPYMTRAELHEEIAHGVEFRCYCEGARVHGVMGLQDMNEVFLIRHAYVRSSHQNKGIGTMLLRELAGELHKPVLIGTWKAAAWAIRFYQEHGFTVVPENEKEVLLRKYWRIPERQVETSVVLADRRYEETRGTLLTPLPS